MSNKDYRDGDVLRSMYIDRGMSMREIADHFDVDNSTISKWANRNGIQTRPKGRHRSPHMGVSVDAEDGYEYVQHRESDGSVKKVKIHRLAAVAWCGLDEVAGSVVHHKNEIPWDNREGNLKTMSRTEHSKHHASEQPWMAGSLYDWLEQNG